MMMLAWMVMERMERVVIEIKCIVLLMLLIR